MQAHTGTQGTAAQPPQRGRSRGEPAERRGRRTGGGTASSDSTSPPQRHARQSADARSVCFLAFPSSMPFPFYGYVSFFSGKHRWLLRLPGGQCVWSARVRTADIAASSADTHLSAASGSDSREAWSRRVARHRHTPRQLEGSTTRIHAAKQEKKNRKPRGQQITCNNTNIYKEEREELTLSPPQRRSAVPTRSGLRCFHTTMGDNGEKHNSRGVTAAKAQPTRERKGAVRPI